MKAADYNFVILSVFFGLLSHLSRAYRWKLMLEPLGYTTKPINRVLTVMISYLSNLGIPRSGELLRATALNAYEKVPFEKGFGTIVAERIIDLAILLSLVGIGLGLQAEIILDLFKKEKTTFSSLFIWGIVLLIGLTIILIRYILKIKPRKIKRLISLFNGLKDGVLAVFKIPKKGIFIAHSLFIWVMYLSMFWVIKFSIGEPFDVSLAAIVLAFIAGGLAMSATNGGIGLYPVAVSTVLVKFEVSSEIALAFGWIIWSSQTVMIVLFGGISFFLLPLVNRNK